MLERAGLEPAAMQCGAHWPIHQPSAQALARQGGVATALHNNCSGKHAGFLCAACALDADRSRYTEPTHPVQRLVKAALENLGGATIGEDVCAVDGCSVPTWAMPLAALARPSPGLGRASACRRSAPRLRRDCGEPAPSIPGMSPAPAGSAPRSCSALASGCSSRPEPRACSARALPDQGLGIAVKCDDGAGRAAEVMMAATLSRLLRAADDRASLEPFVQPTLRNWNGIVVGRLRPTAAIIT